MNEEVQRFIVKITTEGFADLKTTLNETNRLLDEMSKHLDSSKKSGDSFFGALVKWTGLVGGLTAAFVVLKNTIRGVFDTAYDVVDLYQQEQLLGVEARVLEQYGLVAQRNRGTQADAYAFFNDVNELMGKFQSGKITSDDMYKFTKLGIGFQYKRDSSITPEQELAQNRDNYLRALHTAVSNINLNDANKMGIMKDLIKQQSMQTLFMANDEQFEKQMAWGDKWRVLSKNETDLQNSQDLITVELEWKQTIKDFKLQLMPILTEVMKALQPLIPDIKSWITKMGDWIDEHADDIARWVKEGVDWLLHDFPEALKDIFDLLKIIAGMLSPIAEWVIKKLGGTWKGIKDVGGALWAKLVGDPDADKKLGEVTDKMTNGDYGYMSGLYNWLDKTVFPTERLPASNNITNNAPTILIKGDSYFPKDTKIDPNAPTGAMIAHYARSNK